MNIYEVWYPICMGFRGSENEPDLPVWNIHMSASFESFELGPCFHCNCGYCYQTLAQILNGEIRRIGAGHCHSSTVYRKYVLTGKGPRDFLSHFYLGHLHSVLLQTCPRLEIHEHGDEI